MTKIAAFVACLALAPLLRPADNGQTRFTLADSSPRRIVVEEFDRVIPQVVDSKNWTTSIFLTNLDTKAIYFAILFISDDGNRLPCCRVTQWY